MQDGRRTQEEEGAEEERDPTRAGRREPPGSRVRRSEVARSLRGSSERYTGWVDQMLLTFYGGSLCDSIFLCSECFSIFMCLLLLGFEK